MEPPIPFVPVVDDEPQVSKAMARLIRAAGLESASFASGAELLAAVAGRRPDCVVADVHMPGMSGFELKARLGERYPDLPLILITAAGDPDLDARARQAGATALLRKPVGEERLLEVIKDALRRPGPAQP